MSLQSAPVSFGISFLLILCGPRGTRPIMEFHAFDNKGKCMIQALLNLLIVPIAKLPFSLPGTPLASPGWVFPILSWTTDWHLPLSLPKPFFISHLVPDHKETSLMCSLLFLIDFAVLHCPKSDTYVGSRMPTASLSDLSCLTFWSLKLYFYRCGPLVHIKI